MSVLAICKQYNCRPSELFDELDEYTAYCFDEACTFIIVKLQDSKDDDKAKPQFKQKDEEKPVQKFKSAASLYESMGYGVNQYKKTI